MTQHFRKKPVVVEAMQIPPAYETDKRAVFHAWMIERDPSETSYWADGTLFVTTVQGRVVPASVGEWIIPEAGSLGRFYPVAADVFAATYEDADLGHSEASPRHISEWHEDYGDVLWWAHPVTEAPYVGSPLDLGRTIEVTVDGHTKLFQVGSWPGYHEWWTPLPQMPTFAPASVQQGEAR